jgi:hypothetical protein
VQGSIGNSRRGSQRSHKPTQHSSGEHWTGFWTQERGNAPFLRQSASSRQRVLKGHGASDGARSSPRFTQFARLPEKKGILPVSSPDGARSSPRFTQFARLPEKKGILPVSSPVSSLAFPDRLCNSCIEMSCVVRWLASMAEYVDQPSSEWYRCYAARRAVLVGDASLAVQLRSPQLGATGFASTSKRSTGKASAWNRSTGRARGTR